MKKALLFLLSSVMPAACGPVQTCEHPFRAPDLPVDERVENLLSLLTIKEKAGLMMNKQVSIDRLGIPSCNGWSEAFPGAPETADEGVVVWTADSHPAVLRLLGDPQPIATPLGTAVRFDGEDDGVFLDSVPVAGMEAFTLEVVFRQDGDAAFEQRFLHIGTMDRRILLETRVTPGGRWYLDAFVNLGTPEPTPEDPEPERRSAVLIDEHSTHPADRWYTLALTASPEGLASYVDGVEQCRSDLPWEPLVTEGRTSLGVRQNLVCWFRGALYKLRVTPRVLDPADFLQDHIRLNAWQGERPSSRPSGRPDRRN